MVAPRWSTASPKRWAGQGPISADQVAGVALISDPGRVPGGDPLPGRPGQTAPDPAPGTSGTATSQVQLGPVPASGGIAAADADFGDLSGRVAQFCAAGDLACDAPGRAAGLRAAAGIAAQADLRDPIAAAGSLGAVWSQTVDKARAAVVLTDVRVENGQVDYVPQQSISQRVAEAADPRTPEVDPGQQQVVADKVGAVVGAVLADPLTQIPRLIGQVGAAIGQNIADNADLFDPAVAAHYLDVVGSHTGYVEGGQTEQAADWFAALSQDLGDQQ
ncbi:hypothetical protein ACTD5D_40110 [Nocardia takedensis]|uniref:hypothetical protein n=1 Tax=Nocardia takedensis TaxID=259390 RepID=UPI003F7683B8